MSDIFYIKQNDTSPAIRYVLEPASVILTGATVVFSMKNTSTGTVKVSEAAAVIETATVTPTVRYDWIAGDTDTAGLFEAEFEVTYSDSTVETFPNDGNIVVKITAEID